MSIRQTSFVFYGAVLDYPEDARDEDDYYDKFEEYANGYWDKDPKDNVSVVLDGMSGGYCMIGHVIDKTRQDEDYAAHVAIPDVPPSHEQIEHIRDVLVMMGYDRDTKLGWHFLAHYS